LIRLLIALPFLSGTNPASGIGLLASALQKLSQVGSLVVCTTHFLELFSMNLLRDSAAGVRALNMEVQIPESDRETAAPLFKLRRGVALSSAGLACAKLSGVKDSVLKRAREIMATTKDGRRIEPLTEVLRNTVTDGEREAVAAFLTTDWENADDETLNDFRERIFSL
jgi:DNA mismatch repair protein MSH5